MIVPLIVRHGTRSEMVFVTIGDERMRIGIGRHNVAGFRPRKRHAAPSEFDGIPRLRKTNGPRNGSRFTRSIRVEHPIADVVIIPRPDLPRLRGIQNPLSDIRRADAARKIVRVAFGRRRGTHGLRGAQYRIVFFTQLGDRLCELLLLLRNLLAEALRLRPVVNSCPRHADCRSRRYAREFAMRSLIDLRTSDRSRRRLRRRQPDRRGLRPRAVFEANRARRYRDRFHRLKLLCAGDETRAQKPRQQRACNEMKRDGEEKGPQQELLGAVAPWSRSQRRPVMV